VSHGKILSCLLLLTIFAVPLTVYAGSFVLNEQSVSGLGVAFASGAAGAEDASILFFNPAGIVLLDRGELQQAANVVIPSAEFRNEGTRYNLPGTPFNGLLIAGNNGGDAGVTHIIPNTYLTQPVFRNNDYGDLSIGLGLSAPFGLETDYDPGWVGRYASLRSKVTTIDIQPTISYRLFNRLSFGASVDIQRASGRLTQAIDFGLAAQQPLGQFFAALPAILATRGVPPAQIPGVIAATQQAYAAAGFLPGGNDGVTELTGDDWTVGFTIGALFEYRKADDRYSFFQDGRVGFSYRSAMDHTLDGHADFRRVPLITAAGAPVQFPNPTAFQDIFFNQDATASIDLPDIFHFSIYQRFDRQFAIMGDINWTRWSRLQRVPIDFANPGTPATVLNINYEDTVRYAVGLEWYATDRLTLRTGFAYDETPIRSAEFRSPRIPNNNFYFLSAGLRWSPRDWMDIDVGYAHIFEETPRSDFTDNQRHELVGSYNVHVDIVSAAVTVRWGGLQRTAAPHVEEVSGYRK
jgi:long-chain fatty acid transport protein